MVVRVTDSGGLFAQTSFTVTVEARANQAPAIDPVSNRAVQQGTAVSLQLTATDPDHAANTLVFELVSGPLGAAVSTDGQFVWTADLTGDQAITVRVTDPAGASAETSFVIAVAAVGNDAPLLAPIAAQAVIIGGDVTLDLVASDPDDDLSTLIFALESGPQGAAVTPQGRFTWTSNVLGTVPVTVSVIDPSGNRAERSFDITVGAVPNIAPVLAPLNDQTATQGDDLAFQLSAFDADDALATLVFSLVSGPQGAQVTPDGRLTWQAATLGDADFTIRVTDPDGAFDERSFNITVSARPNIAPVIDPQPVVSVAEGQQVLLDLTATDADGPADALAWELVSGPSGAVLTPQGRLTWLAPDGAASAEFAVRVSDGKGGITTGTVTVNVTDVAPVLTVVGSGSAGAGLVYRLQLALTDPGQDTPQEWRIDWGDGTVVSSLAGTASAAEHVFAGAGRFTVRATLRNEDGTFTAQPLVVDVAAAPLLQVTGSGIVGGRLVVRFSQALAALPLTGTPVTLVGSAVGAVTTALTLDANGALVIARVDGKALQYDSYALELSAPAFASARGSLLDGDADGAPGGNYRTTLRFEQARPGLASLPDFLRVPGEKIDVPREAQDGLQVRFASEGGVKTLRFTVQYDPALLALDGVNAGPDLPEGAKLTWEVLPASGGKALVRVTVISDTPIAAGSVALASLDARVPQSAPYGASEVLEVQVEMINAADPTALARDEALQVVGTFGDADGDQILTILDTYEITRLAVRSEGEFAAWSGIPPELIADIRDSRFFNSPRLPIIDPLVAADLRLHRSTSAPMADLPEVTYGFAQAVAKWAGDIWTTDTTPLPPEEGVKPAEKPAEKGAPATPKAANPEVHQTAPDGTGPLTNAPAPGTPALMLANLLAGPSPSGFMLEDALIAVGLPVLIPNREDRAKGRRRKAEEEAV
ncbi:MAG: hypothetical protein B7Y74_02350 [Novosphingobium sp. 35-62-5]|nr:MAG: hypothetical protein B7Y74_02350 [Novosphingobium sp. 35-62-5]